MERKKRTGIQLEIPLHKKLQHVGIKCTTKLDRRFWSKVDIKTPKECWNWKASCGWRSYGKFKINKTFVNAHRVAYELFYKNLRENLVVCHRCDNPLCCNPHHLFQGTQSDNNIDKSLKGRSTKGKLCRRGNLL